MNDSNKASSVWVEKRFHKYTDQRAFDAPGKQQQQQTTPKTHFSWFHIEIRRITFPGTNNTHEKEYFEGKKTSSQIYLVQKPSLRALNRQQCTSHTKPLRQTQHDTEKNGGKTLQNTDIHE